MSIVNGDVGSRLSLVLAGYGQLHATVLKPFSPFTKSEVYLVDVDLATGPSSVPTRAVLKVFDPRALNDRFILESNTHPWTIGAERAAAAIREEVRLGVRLDLFDERQLYAVKDDSPEAAARLEALWEEHYYRLAMECFESELAAYDLLKDLQGSTICRLYASGRLLPTDVRAIEPPVVLTEYIDGCTLKNLRDPERVPSQLCGTLIRDVDSFAARGLIHADVKPNNIIFTPVDNPSRVVLIDFGCALIREEDDDEQWNLNVTFYGDRKWIRRELVDVGIRIDEAVRSGSILYTPPREPGCNVVRLSQGGQQKHCV